MRFEWAHLETTEGCPSLNTNFTFLRPTRFDFEAAGSLWEENIFKLDVKEFIQAFSHVVREAYSMYRAPLHVTNKLLELRRISL